MRYSTVHRFCVLAVIITGGLLLAGCDSLGEGEETITLNNNTGLEPIVYKHQYSQEDVQEGIISVSASSENSLDALLEKAAAASRSDIVSAKVTNVTFRRITGKRTAFGDGPSEVSPKVFPYLSRAEVYLGGESGPLIATAEPVPVPENNRDVTMTLGTGASDVASVLKNGDTLALLQLRLNDPDNVGEPFDEIEIKVSYSIEVSS